MATAISSFSHFTSERKLSLLEHAPDACKLFVDAAQYDRTRDSDVQLICRITLLKTQYVKNVIRTLRILDDERQTAILPEDFITLVRRIKNAAASATILPVAKPHGGLSSVILRHKTLCEQLVNIAKKSFTPPKTFTTLSMQYKLHGDLTSLSHIVRALKHILLGNPGKAKRYHQTALKILRVVGPSHTIGLPSLKPHDLEYRVLEQPDQCQVIYDAATRSRNVPGLHKAISEAYKGTISRKMIKRLIMNVRKLQKNTEPDRVKSAAYAIFNLCHKTS
ncbi:MAG: hypothetical protein SP1CHLAM54_17380 [Chlamydiia bacterium]|nr:hypothetical protein [Chlamydiia bacterium]MCH9616626.1 hypothetical protein [Chlamydiia bacterium]MCH9629356.1 hypothetical protein [Chlamydiia bacterium]